MCTNAMNDETLLKKELQLLEKLEMSKEEYQALKLNLNELNLVSQNTCKRMFNTETSNVSEIEISLINTDADIKFDDLIATSIRFKEGLTGTITLNANIQSCQELGNLFLGNTENEDLDMDTCESILCEVSNQIAGATSICFSKLLNDTVDISTPTILRENTEHSITSLLKSMHEELITIKFTINLFNSALDIFMLLPVTSFKTSIFKIKNTQNQNFLLRSPELAKNVAEFFTVIASKYKSTFSMLGSIKDVILQELNSIHSLQCLDADIINKYNISNTNSKKDLYNIYIFDNDFVEELEKTLYTEEELEDSPSNNNGKDVLNELNQQFNHIFLSYSTDKYLNLDTTSCNEFLQLPDDRYILISFGIGEHTFYQLTSVSIIESIDVKKCNEASFENTNSSIEINSITDQSGSVITKVTTIQKTQKTKYENLPLTLSVVLGEKTVSLEELIYLTPGYTINLGVRVNDDVDVYLESKVKAKGEVGQLTLNRANNYAVKIKKIVRDK